MRRWLAIPVAAIIAVAAGAITWTTAPTADAGAPPPTDWVMSVDCDVSAGGIQTLCNPSAGAYAVDVYLTNNSGSSAQLGAFGFKLQVQQAQLLPSVPACDASGLNCNPDFNQAAVTGAGWACSPPAPNPDEDAGGATALSSLGCFNGPGDGPTIADGASINLARVNYTASNGLTPIVIVEGNAYDVNFTELGSCNTVISVAMNCPDSIVQVGAAGPTATPVPTDTPVPPTATATNTCVVGQTCATATSEAYVTVTPTPGPETPTVPASGTTVPGTTPPPPPPPPPTGGTPPGGTTGGGRPGGSITLPDTGTNDGGSSNTWMFALAAVAVLGSAGLASGVWYSAAAARRRGED